MKATLTSISLTILFCFLSPMACADNVVTSPSPALEGNYKCKWIGSLLNNSDFSLTLSKTGDTYSSTWEDTTGNPLMYGTGIINANAPNVFTTSFWNVTNTTIAGVISVTIKPDGTLQGNWLSQSGKDSGTETCTKS